MTVEPERGGTSGVCCPLLGHMRLTVIAHTLQCYSFPVVGPHRTSPVCDGFVSRCCFSIVVYLICASVSCLYYCTEYFSLSVLIDCGPF